jgi:hypothetical protein
LDLLSFVRALPEGYAYAPIYADGAVMPGDGKPSRGKSPHGRARYVVMGPADVALQIERHPEVFKAVGVFTGARSRGLVILDVDANLARLKRKWGSSLEGAPCVTSTKANAAKFLFRVPERHWGEVKGLSLAATGAGYEVLWGRQGLLYGAYPGSSDGKAPVGEYALEGDLRSIPEAPAWLLAEMREAAAASDPVDGKGFLKNRKALDVSDRTEDEIAEIAQDCLRVIPQQGAGSRDHWLQVGMAIHSALPSELGLTLWSAWSAEDPEYAQEWADGNQCERPWTSFKQGGGIGFATLIWLADQQDPLRRRFSDASRSVVEAAEARQVQEVRQATLSFDEAMARMKVLMELDDPGKRNYELNQLALQAGYRDQCRLEQVYVDHIGYVENPGEITADRLAEFVVRTDYLIPDLLPTPAVVLVYGKGGDGKSMSVWTLGRHVLEGMPFMVRGRPVPVQQGGVVILNGDQPLNNLHEQLHEADFPLDDRTLIRGEWSLHYYAQFVELMKRRRPKLVIIDSLIGCAGGKAFDENKSEFAQPLYWLTRNNGVLYPATTILVIHHANKQGGFRGTSAIRDAVNEVWALKKPEGPLLEEVGPASRIITIEKSRCGRGDSRLLMRMEDDLSFSIRDWTPEVNPEDATPASHSDRVLQRLRTVFPRTLRQTDLNADPLVGGRVAATKKALQRLVKRGLIEVAESVAGPRGSTAIHYRAVLVQGDTHTTCARGEGKDVSPGGHSPCAAMDRPGDTPPVENESVPRSEVGLKRDDATGGHLPPEEASCPPVKASRAKGSATGGHSGEYPHARVREAAVVEPAVPASDTVGGEEPGVAEQALNRAATLWD